MSVESLDNEERRLVDDAMRKSYRYLDDGIEGIGGMIVAAGLCATDRSDLRKALDRNGRRIPLDYAIAIAARIRRTNASLATKIGSAIVHPLDLDVFPRVTMTDKERADRMEAFILRMPMGDQLLDDALRVKR